MCKIFIYGGSFMKQIEKEEILTPDELKQIVKINISEYADKNGISYKQAKNEAYWAYEIKYHVNLKERAREYAKFWGLKSCSRLDYLNRTDRIDDFVKVVDTLINPWSPTASPEADEKLP